MRQRGRVILLGVVAASALVCLVAWLVETDEEAIERVTETCRTAFLAGDAAGILALLTEDAESGGMIGRGALDPLVRRWVAEVSGRLTGASLSLREIVVDGDEARGGWVSIVRMKPGEPVPAFRIEIRIEFHREPEGWRIRRAVVASR